MRIRTVVLLITILCGSAWGQSYTISTLAGTGMPVNVSGTSVSLGYGSGLSKTPQYIAADAAATRFSLMRHRPATGRHNGHVDASGGKRNARL